MTIITRDLLKTLRIDINAALVEVAKKHKLAIGAGNASFTASSATFKLNLVNLTGDADTVSSCDVRHIKAEHDFKAHVFVGNHAFDSRAFKEIENFVRDENHSTADRASALRHMVMAGMGESVDPDAGKTDDGWPLT